jgi:hypothetical protein
MASYPERGDMSYRHKDRINQGRIGGHNSRSHHRRLRLKGGENMIAIEQEQGYDSLDFDYSMIEKSIFSRLFDFDVAFKRVVDLNTNQSNSIISRIRSIDVRLRHFGYSLNSLEGHVSPFSGTKNRFIPSGKVSHHFKDNELGRTEDSQLEQFYFKYKDERS